MLQQSDFLHELEQGRLRFRGFHYGFQRGLVIGELLAGITTFDTQAVIRIVRQQPALVAAGFAWFWLIRAARGVFNRIIFRALAAVEALVSMGTE